MKIVLIDDEDTIRLGMEKIIRSQFPQFQIAGSFDNAAEALAAICSRELEAHVVITDIKMPYMDGLSFIETLRASRPDVRCIILSGYNNFEYARKAIQYGVEDYLVKPLDKQELYQLLLKVQEELAAEQERLRRQGSRRTEEALRRMLEGGEGRPGTEEGELPPLERMEAVNGLLVIRLSHETAAERLLLELNRQVMPSIAAVVQMNERTIAVLASLELQAESGAKALRRVSLRIVDSLQNRCGGFMAVGEQLLPPGTGEWARAYQEALAASRSSYLDGAGNSVTAAAEMIARTEHSRISIYSLDEQLKTVCELRDCGGCLELLKRYFSEIEKNRLPYDEMVYVIGNVFYTLMTKVEGLSDCLKELEGRTFDFREELLRRFGFENVKEWLPRLVRRWFEALAARPAPAGSRVLDTVKALIQERFHEEIDMVELAEAVYLNPSYLSAMFRKETGQTLTEFVIQLRMTRAKELLRERLDLKAYQVGELVGYGDGVYFSKIFKKHVGVTPQQFRNLAFRQ